MVIGYAPISTNASGRTIIADKPPLPPVEKQALYDALQPDAQLLAGPPPAFIVYAGNDPVVPVDNAHRLAGAWRDAGVAMAAPVRSMVASGRVPVSRGQCRAGTASDWRRMS